MLNNAKLDSNIKSVVIKANGNHFSGGNDLSNFFLMLQFDHPTQKVNII